VCKSEAKNLQYISKYYKLKTIAVKSGDDEEIQNYLNQNNLTYSFINDKDGLVASKYHINIFPTTITCENKKVKFVDVGYTSTLGLFIRQWF
jgi:peroxiredoxin